MRTDLVESFVYCRIQIGIQFWNPAGYDGSEPYCVEFGPFELPRLLRPFIFVHFRFMVCRQDLTWSQADLWTLFFELHAFSLRHLEADCFLGRIYFWGSFFFQHRRFQARNFHLLFASRSPLCSWIPHCLHCLKRVAGNLALLQYLANALFLRVQ